MARKTIGVATEPHVVEIGDKELLFKPFVTGAEYLTAYDKMREKDPKTKRDENAPVTVEDAERAAATMKAFLAEFMLPESVELFLGKVVDEEVDDDGERTVKREGGMRLPDPALLEMSNFVNEIYGGGTRPTGSSSASPQRSSKGGRSSTASTRSKAKTPARGRSTG